jgi:hypothetical protein
MIGYMFRSGSMTSGTTGQQKGLAEITGLKYTSENTVRRKSRILLSALPRLPERFNPRVGQHRWW